MLTEEEKVGTTVTVSAPQQEENDIWHKIMEQNLEGVMFHLYSVDLFDLLDLKGFKKMHEYQVKEEAQELNNLKHKYIKLHNKIPILKSENKYWLKEENKNFTHEEISEMVKESMENYANWESEVLEHLLKWKRLADDKQLVHSMVEGVMKEIKYIETIINVLEEHNYNYICICEMSDYLYKVY
jgi:phenylalanyl-tRNA synthetase alpha subunit